VTFDRSSYAAVKATLLDRYGPSHARSVEESGETLTWSGTRVAMSLREDAGGRLAALEIRER
jgi:hypothetical protein